MHVYTDPPRAGELPSESLFRVSASPSQLSDVPMRKTGITENRNESPEVATIFDE